MKKVDKAFMKIHHYIRNILWRKICKHQCSICRISALCCEVGFFNIFNPIKLPLFNGRWRTMSKEYKNELKNFIVTEILNENSLNKDIISIFQTVLRSKEPDLVDTKDVKNLKFLPGETR